MLFEFFLWLDRGFEQYWAFQWGAFALCLAAALLPWRRDRWWGCWNHPVLFAALALLLIIAHRLSAVREANRILVMDKGQIVESGPHDALVQKPNGLYAHLWAMQDGGQST